MSISNLPILRVLNPSPIASIDLELGTSLKNLYNSTLYESILQLLRQRMGLPFVLDELNISVNVYSQYCEAIIQPRVLSGQGQKYGETLVVRYDRYPLNSLIQHNFFFDGNLPMSFNEFAQYIFDRHGFVIESGEFDLVYFTDLTTQETQTIELTENTILSTMGVNEFVQLVVKPHSARWVAGGIIKILLGEIRQSHITPLTLQWNNAGFENKLVVQLSGHGGVVPYTYSIVNPITRFVEGVGYSDYPITLDSVTGLMSDFNAPVGLYQTRLRVTDSMGSTAHVDVVVDIEDTNSTELVFVNTTLSTWSPIEYSIYGWDKQPPFPHTVEIPIGPNENIIVDTTTTPSLREYAVQNVVVEGQTFSRVYVTLRKFEITPLHIRLVDSDTGSVLNTYQFRLVPQPRTVEQIQQNLLWTFMRSQVPGTSSSVREGNWIVFEGSEISHTDGNGRRTHLDSQVTGSVVDKVGDLVFATCKSPIYSLNGPTAGHDNQISHLISSGHAVFLNNWFLKTGRHVNFVNGEENFIDLEAEVDEDVWNSISASAPLRPSFQMTIRIGQLSGVQNATILSTRDYRNDGGNKRIQFLTSNHIQPRLIAKINWGQSEAVVVSNTAIPNGQISTWTLVHHTYTIAGGELGYIQRLIFTLYRNGVVDGTVVVERPLGSMLTEALDFQQLESPGGPGIVGYYSNNQSPPWRGTIEYCSFNWWDLDEELIDLLANPALKDIDQLVFDRLTFTPPQYTPTTLSMVGYVGERTLLQLPVDPQTTTFSNGTVTSFTQSLNVMDFVFPENAKIETYVDPDSGEESLVFSAEFTGLVNDNFTLAIARQYHFSSSVDAIDSVANQLPVKFSYFDIQLNIQQALGILNDEELKYWSSRDNTAGTQLSNIGSGYLNRAYQSDSVSKLVRSYDAILEDSYIEMVVTTSNGVYVGPGGAREVAVGIMDGYPKLREGDYQLGQPRVGFSPAGTNDSICVYFPSREIVSNGQVIGTLSGYGNRVGFAVTPTGHVSIRGTQWHVSPPPAGLIQLNCQGYPCVAAELIHSDARADIATPSTILLPPNTAGFKKGIAQVNDTVLQLNLDHSVGITAYADSGSYGVTWVPQNNARPVLEDTDMPSGKAYRFDHDGYIQVNNLTLPNQTFSFDFYIKPIQTLPDNNTASLVRFVSATHYLDITVSKILGDVRFGLRYRLPDLSIVETNYVGNSALASTPPHTLTDPELLGVHHLMLVRGNDQYFRLCLDGTYWSTGIHLPDFMIEAIRYGIGSAPLTSNPYPVHYGQLRLRLGHLEHEVGETFTPDLLLT